MRAKWTVAIAALASVLLVQAAGAQGNDVAAADSPAIMPPVPITDHYDTQGKYPLESMLHEDQGDVHLEYTIEKDGTVDKVVVTQSSHHPRLDDASIKLVKSWLYHPATRDGIPVAVTDNTVVKWHMEREPEPIQEPVQLFMAKEDFPPGAWDRREEGIDKVFLSIDASGKITGYHSEGLSGYADLDTAAKDFLTNRSHITPPTIAGKPVAGQVEAIIVWSMKPHKDVRPDAFWRSPQ